MQAMTPLHTLIATYILTQDTPVSLTAIYARAQGRFTDEDVRKAMSVIHKTRRDIKVTDDGKEQWYSKRVLKPRTITAPPPRHIPTPEERAEKQKVIEDYFMLCPFVTEEERVCYNVRKTDRTRYKTCPCATCTGWRWLLMTTLERGYFEKNREREFLKTL